MNERHRYLGIEGGGTRSIAIVSDALGQLLQRQEFGAGNVRLLSDRDLIALFSQIASACPDPICIGAGMAGARDEADRARVLKAIAAVWGDVPAFVTHDLEIALAAARQDSPCVAQVLVLSGTGSCCYGRCGEHTAKVGGWGHLLGDKSSGYAIALAALRKVVFQFDRFGKFEPLAQGVLRSLALNEPNDLITWIQDASKADVAALARCVFESSTDPIAKEVLQDAAESLATDAHICGSRLAKKGEAISFVLAGSVLLKQPAFAKKISTLIRKEWPRAHVTSLKGEAAWGAIELAQSIVLSKRMRPARRKTAVEHYVPEFDPASSPTEQRNPASQQFHRLSTARMIDVMLGAEKDVIPALLKERRSIIRAVDLAAETLRVGGRVFYVGAGTSGRLGVLDASECPPTFRASPEMIQGIIAGGQRALWQAVEGAEDDAEAGARALHFRALTPQDLVIGIAASGRTPFVWGALGFARRTRAKTILVSFNPSLKIDAKHRPTVVIAPNLGPEILTGSTRLKSGTATKLILNMISTIAMVRLGKVISNLMVDLNPSNVKLRDRAIRIVQELTGCTAADAKTALEKRSWIVKDAWSEIRNRKKR